MTGSFRKIFHKLCCGVKFKNLAKEKFKNLEREDYCITHKRWLHILIGTSKLSRNRERFQRPKRAELSKRRNEQNYRRDVHEKYERIRRSKWQEYDDNNINNTNNLTEKPFYSCVKWFRIWPKIRKRRPKESDKRSAFFGRSSHIWSIWVKFTFHFIELNRTEPKCIWIGKIPTLFSFHCEDHQQWSKKWMILILLWI